MATAGPSGPAKGPVEARYTPLKLGTQVWRDPLKVGARDLRWEARGAGGEVSSVQSDGAVSWGSGETEVRDSRGRREGLLGRDSISAFSQMIREPSSVSIPQGMGRATEEGPSAPQRRVLGWRSCFARSEAKACSKTWGPSREPWGGTVQASRWD